MRNELETTDNLFSGISTSRDSPRDSLKSRSIIGTAPHRKVEGDAHIIARGWLRAKPKHWGKCRDEEIARPNIADSSGFV